MENNEGKLFRNTLLLTGAAALSKGAVFFLMPLYTAALGPARFGTADVLVSTAILLIPFVSLGMPEAVFRFGARGENGEDAVFTTGVFCFFAGMALFLLLCPLFLLSAFFRPYVPVLFLYVFASASRGMLAHILRARGAYPLYAAQQLFCALLTIALEVLFLRAWRLGVIGYLAAVIAADGTTALILFFTLRAWRWCSFRGVRAPLARAMLRYAVPLMPTAVLWWITAVSDRYILLFYHGEAVTGLYAAAGRITAVLTFALGIFLEAWHYAALRAEETARGALFSHVWGMLAPVLLFAALALMLTARFTVRLLFAAAFAAAARVVPYLAAAAFFSCLCAFFGSVYTVRLTSGRALLTALAGAALNVALNFLWIPRMGAIGAALATFFSYVCVFLLRAGGTARVLPFSFRGAKLFACVPGLLATAALCAAGSPWAFAAATGAMLPFFADFFAAVRFTVRRAGVFAKAFRRGER